MSTSIYFCFIRFNQSNFTCLSRSAFVALDDAIRTFEEAEKVATTKAYDYLDPRNIEFDTDYDDFISKTDALKQNIGNTIENNYADVWETLQGIRFLTRFEKVM